LNNWYLCRNQIEAVNDTSLEPVKDTATFDIATDITETPIQHARKRALSGQQIHAEKLMRTTKRKLSELSAGSNVIFHLYKYLCVRQFAKFQKLEVRVI
jgi:hypothetical protein